MNLNLYNVDLTENPTSLLRMEVKGQTGDTTVSKYKYDKRPGTHYSPCPLQGTEGKEQS